MTGQLGVEPSSLEGLRTLVKPKLPKGSFETLNRDMTGQLGVEPSSLEGLRKWQGLGLVDPMPWIDT